MTPNKYRKKHRRCATCEYWDGVICNAEFNSELVNEYKITHCPYCGQALDWGGIKDES